MVFGPGPGEMGSGPVRSGFSLEVKKQNRNNKDWDCDACANLGVNLAVSDSLGDRKD